MVSIASNPRLENWTELDMDQNWTGSETKLGPLTQNLDLKDIDTWTDLDNFGFSRK